MIFRLFLPYIETPRRPCFRRLETLYPKVGIGCALNLTFKILVRALWCSGVRKFRQSSPPRAPYSFIKEFTLSHVRNPYVISGIFLNSAILGSVGQPEVSGSAYEKLLALLH